MTTITKKFDGEFEVSLTIKEDGTAEGWVIDHSDQYPEKASVGYYDGQSYFVLGYGEASSYRASMYVEDVMQEWRKSL